MSVSPGSCSTITAPARDWANASHSALVGENPYLSCSATAASSMLEAAVRSASYPRDMKLSIARSVGQGPGTEPCAHLLPVRESHAEAG